MSEDKPEALQHRGIGVLLAFVVLPVLYVLSFVPMHILYYRTSNPVIDMVYDTLYLPLDWLYMNTSLLDGLVHSCEELLE